MKIPAWFRRPEPWSVQKSDGRLISQPDRQAAQINAFREGLYAAASNSRRGASIKIDETKRVVTVKLD